MKRPAKQLADSLNKSGITVTRQEAKTFKIPQFAVKQSLDDYFHDFILDIHACLHFLTRYAVSNPDIADLTAAYNSYKDKEKLDPTKFSLDTLVEQAGMDPGDFRRL